MSKAQAAAWGRKGFRNVVPGYVPAGFRLKKVALSNDKDPLMVSGTLTYTHRSGAYFVIQVASDGIGDPMFTLPGGDVVEPNGFLKGTSKLFGPFELMIYKKGPHLMAHTTWYELPGKQYPRFVMLLSHKVQPAEARKIVLGLRWAP